MGSVTDLVKGGVEFFVEPDVRFWSELQAVWTRGVLCVFSQDSERPFTFGSSGLQCDGSGWICCPRLPCAFWGLVLYLESR